MMDIYKLDHPLNYPKYIMTYNSQVAIALTQQVYDNMPQEVQKAFSTSFCKPKFYEYEDIKAVYYYHPHHAQWYRWFVDYNPFIEGKIIMDWLNTLDEKSFAYIMLGDDFLDTTIQGTPANFDLGYIRKISLPL